MYKTKRKIFHILYLRTENLALNIVFHNFYLNLLCSKNENVFENIKERHLFMHIFLCNKKSVSI